ncbi:hypothetical protein BOTBODRAFT_297584 [Botryobasidium botryosum FD-172 SS1]|uniref:C2 domain-containing protein n=1 Tax=Botryobasidium botryosum (strain FD-172 SS1) TaxID=930990 RepID=A0A067MHQ2_BOTB1|nr:hypothetical protein BOTBODRAFT_297584 [Botryobasidium botryosum FD-172 SS1]
MDSTPTTQAPKEMQQPESRLLHVRITINGANGLPKKKGICQPDTFAVLYTDNESRFQTNIYKRSTNPTWNDTPHDIMVRESTVLKVEVRKKKKFREASEVVAKLASHLLSR